MRLVFMGNPDFSLPALHALSDSSHELLAVVVGPDRPRGRGRKLVPLPVKAAALELGIPVHQPPSLKNPTFLDEMRKLELDAFIVVAFRILPAVLFSLPRFGSLNIHPSLLPKGRGPAPIQWTLLRGETETGVSIIQLNENIDGGAILRQEQTPIGSRENFGDLHDRLGGIGARMIVRVLDDLADGVDLQPIEQDESQVTSARKLFAEDFVIDWRQPAKQIYNRIRAFSPVPGAAVSLSGTAFKILDAEFASDSQLAPGQLRQHHETLIAGTGDGALTLIRVKPAGKRAMTIAEYLRGCRELPEYLDLD